MSDQIGPKCTECIEPFGKDEICNVSGYNLPFCHIVEARISCDVIQRFIFGHVFHFSLDHSCQFAFVVNTLSVQGEDNCFYMSNKGR